MSVRWNQVTALFGGTFDPPHIGHFEAVRGLFRNPGVGRVVVLPAAQPPHKALLTPSEHRVAMTKLCFRVAPTANGVGPIAIDGREIDRHSRTGEPSYSFDTIQEVRREASEIAFVIGADQLEKLREWRRFPDLLGLCHWIVLTRRPDGEKVARAVLAEWKESGLIRAGANEREWILSAPTARQEFVLVLCDTQAPEISSSFIREAIARSGKLPENALSEPVSGYLKENHLYGT